jgi:hypothetical protein
MDYYRIDLNSEKNNEKSLEWKKDPLNDTELYQILKFELPRAGNYCEDLLNIKYIWEEGKRIIKHALLIIHCSNCDEIADLEIDREKLITKKDDRSDKCHDIYCNGCVLEGKFDRRYFFNRNFKRIITKDYPIERALEQDKSFVINVNSEVPVSTNSHVYDSKKLVERESYVETVHINREDINDIEILKFINSLNEQKIQWCTVSFIVKNMVIIKTYLNQRREQTEISSFSLYLRELISDLIDRKMLRQKNPNYSPRFPSVFRLTREGKYYIQKWQLLKDVIKYGNVQDLVENFISQKLPQGFITQKNILIFFQVESGIRWNSLDYIKENMNVVRVYWAKAKKIRKKIKNFPGEKYFSESYNKVKLDSIIKIELEKKLDKILLESISRLINQKYLKRRKNKYRLTWKGELYSIL